MTLAADPIGSGLVANLAHPGGNLTGMSALASDLASKLSRMLIAGLFSRAMFASDQILEA
jgi:ABC-type uncharacterized transport system substrate-binding protein